MKKIPGILQSIQRKGWTPLKYLLSSCLAFAIDYFLLLFFDAAIPSAASMEIGAFLAWCISSLTNFFCNRNLVFHSTAALKRALPEYYSLAVVVFLIKTYVILELLTRVFLLPLKIAKPIAEVILFIGNYIIQKKLIFKKKNTIT